MRRVLIGCADFDRYIRVTLCVGKFSTIGPSQAFRSESNGVIKSEMRMLEVGYILIYSLLLSI